MAAKKPANPDVLPAMAFICGEERLLSEDAYETLRLKAMAAIQAPDFNHDRLSGRKASIQDIINACHTLPVMSPRRLVEVKEAEGLDLKEADALIEYAKNPDPTTTLLLLGDKPDLRLRFYKQLDETGVLHVHEKMNERAVASWLEKRCRVHAISLQQEAVDTLVGSIGAELMLLDRALEKLALVVGKNGVVTSDVVAEHVAVTRVETSFKIVDALAAGNVGEALEATLSVLDAGEPALRLLGALAYAQRNSIRFLDMLLAGEPVGVAARNARIFKNEAVLATRLKNAGRENLARGLSAIADADRALKGSPVNDEEVMAGLILELSRLQRPASSVRAPAGSPARR